MCIYIYIYIYPPAPGASSTAACCCPRWRWCRPWRPAGCGSRTSSSAAGSLRPRRRRLKHQDCSSGYLAVTVALSSLVLIMIAVRSTCSGPLSDGPLLPYLTLHASQLLCSSILKSFVTIIVLKNLLFRCSALCIVLFTHPTISHKHIQCSPVRCLGESVRPYSAALYGGGGDSTSSFSSS